MLMNVNAFRGPQRASVRDWSAIAGSRSRQQPPLGSSSPLERRRMNSAFTSLASLLDNTSRKRPAMADVRMGSGYRPGASNTGPKGRGGGGGGGGGGGVDIDALLGDSATIERLRGNLMSDMARGGENRGGQRGGGGAEEEVMQQEERERSGRRRDSPGGASPGGRGRGGVERGRGERSNGGSMRREFPSSASSLGTEGRREQREPRGDAGGRGGRGRGEGERGGGGGGGRGEGGRRAEGGARGGHEGYGRGRGGRGGDRGGSTSGQYYSAPAPFQYPEGEDAPVAVGH